jgi:nicotinate phosphoribosyltransferase
MTSAAPTSLALFTDLYELRMARAYHGLAMDGRAVFSLFVRRLPETRNYLIAAGVEPFVEALETLRFSDEDLRYLAALGEFPDEFLSWLRGFRFTGEVHALTEGTPFFENEPILEVVAPIAEAQLIETLVMNMVGLEIVLASKAARVVAAAQGRGVVDFGTRRAQGIDAALSGARAFHIAGCNATSNVLAGMRLGIPTAGTMAHSFIEAFDSEADAFRAFMTYYPETILLVDTYDTLAGVDKAIALARELGAAFKVHGIRLDSGDMAALAKEARKKLDAAGLNSVQVFASGGLDEHALAALLAAGAPIDAFGVGTDMSVSADAPSLDIAYKLTEYGGRGRMKLSEGKRTLPGRKQVFRRFRNDIAHEDVIARADETLDGTPLLKPVMKDGKRLSPPTPLAQLRAGCAAALAKLPKPILALQPAAPRYPVHISDALAQEEQEIIRRVSQSG